VNVTCWPTVEVLFAADDERTVVVAARTSSDDVPVFVTIGLPSSVAVTARVVVPIGVLLVVDMVSVEVPEGLLPVNGTEVGENTALAPAGNPVILSVAERLPLPLLLTVTV
jgi:acyl CoA:acetate/3-ketoacid CoA transferase beta subunit